MEGDTIIAEGELGDKFYIVKDGEVACTKEGVAGEVCPRLTAGSYFGELALLNDSKRAATVTAAADTTCLTMSSVTFKRLLGPLEVNLRRNSVVYEQYLSEAVSKFEESSKK
jgi:cAMP-dependent protein kinase regulator